MFTLAGKVIERAFQALCDMGEEETLETAVAKVHGPEDTLLPQHAGEMDLNSLSEEALMELANYSNYGIQSEATCREKLENLRSFRQKHPGAGTDMAKANRAINALRARIKLLMMAQKSTKWVAQTEQHQQQQLQEQQQQQQQQLQRSAAAGTALSGGSRADYFTAYQTPKRLGQPQGKNSDRHARAMQQGQRGKVVVLDSIMQLAGKPQQTAQQPAAGRKPAPQPSRPASTGPQYSSGMPSLYGPPTQGQARQQQQQQQHQQRLENQLIYQQQPRAGPQLARRAQQQQQQQGGQFTQLQLAPSQPGAAAAVKPAYSWGTRDLRGSQQQGAVCDQCGKAPAKTQVVLGGVSMCQQCEREQRAMLDNAGSKGMKAAPLRQDKLPARPAGITARPAAAPRAAGARRRGKAQGSEDAPITIDSDDEQEQQQQGAGAAAAAAAAAAGDVEHMTLSSDGEGPSGGGRRRRSSRISLLDPDPGTAARFAGLHIVYPPEGGKGAVVVTPDDLARLDSGEFLNDTIIDFYTKWVELQLASSSPQAAGRFHFFNSFFYKKLSEAGSEPKGRSPGRPELARRAHGRVKTWTKGVDIFAKDFLLVPIHDALHWSLAIVCHPALFAQRMQQAAEQAAVPAAEAAGAAALARAAGGGGAAEPAAAAAGAAAGAAAAAAAGGTGVEAQPVIIHLDSMAGGHTTATIVNYLRYFLVQEWLAQQRRARAAAAAAAAAEGAATAGKESSPAPEQQPELQEPANAFEAKLLPSCKVSALPRQDNHCDCGLFVLAYLEYFVHADPPALSPEAVRNAKVELSPVEPRLMREGWFHPEVAYCLRDHLRHMLLDLMLQQAPDKELPGAVAAVADTAKYSEQLEVQRKDVEERGSEVNPVFGYVPPSEYARVRQQLAQYQQRQEEAKAARKAAAAAEKRKSGAERKRDALRQQQQQPEQQQQWLEQQQQHDAAAGHGGEPGAGGLFAVDYTSLDEQPLAAQAVPQGQQHTPAAQQQQQQQHRPQHIVFSVSDDEQGNDAVAASPAARAAAAEGSAAAGGTPAAGGGCRPGSAAAAPGWQGDDGDDDDFVEPRSKRRSGGGQQQHAKRIKPSQQQQQHGQQRQHALHPEQEDDPVLGDEQQLQQQQQQGQRPSRRLRSTEEVREQRRQRSLPPDDAGGSGVSSDSSGSLGRAGGAVAARRQEQQQQWRQPTPTPPPAAADEDEAEDMSVDEPPLQKQVGPAAAGPAAERDAQPAACTPHTRAAAAAADTVDLCSDDEDDAQPPQHSSKRPRTAQQQQQQVSDPEWESCEGGDDAAQHAEPSPQPAAPPLPQQQQQHSRQQGHQQQGAKHPDEEALALLLPCHHADPSSMEQLWKMLGGEFEHYGADLVRMVRSGAVTAQDRVKMLDMLKEELGRRPPKRLLPYLLEKVQLLAVDATAQAADAARTEAAWQQLGLKQPQPQPAAAAKRPGSSGKMGSSRTGSAAKRGSRSRAAPDAAAGGGGGRGQRKLREVLPQGATLDFAGTVDPRIIASSVAKLVVRSREEHAGSGSDCAGGSSEHGGSSEAGGCSEQGGPPAELGDLRLGSQDEAADAAGGSSVLALLPQQQQQQQADVEVVDFTNDSDVEEQQQQPVAPSPWPVTGAAAQQAQRASAAAQQPLVRGQVADMLGSDDGDHPAGVASWQQQQHRSRHEQQQQQQQQQNPWQQQQQQQQLMRQLTNATAVGFSPALQEFWNGPGMQAGQMPASITAAGRQQQQQQQPAPLSPNVMPYGASDSVAGDSRQLRQDSGPTEELATGATDEHEDDAAADPDWRGVHEEDITSPARPAPPLAATAAAPPLPLLPAGAGGVTAHGSSSQQHTAAAAALLASPMRATRSSCPQQRAPAAGRLPQEYPALA